MFSIVRAYANPHEARAAVEDLVAEGFPASAVSLYTPAGTDDSAPEGVHATHAMRSGYLMRNLDATKARVMMQAAEEGNSLVAVQAVFGKSAVAERVLDKHNPIKLEFPRDERLYWDDAAPLSSALMLPVLIKTKPNPPVGNYLTFGKPLMNSKFSLFGDGLMKNPTPLSSMLGLKPLMNDKPMTKLSGNKTYLFGGSLSNDPAPLSRLLGIPTLF